LAASIEKTDIDKVEKAKKFWYEPVKGIDGSLPDLY